MLRKLLIITLLLGTFAGVYAQKKDKKKGKKQNTEQSAAEQVDYKKLGSPMPDMRVVTRDGKEITTRDLTNDANLFIMLFNPTCEHCQEETIQLEKNISLFKKSKLLLIAAPSMMTYLEFYNNVTRYSKYPNIMVGVDSMGYVDKTFIYNSLPQINIYDKDRKLLRIFSGETPIDTLKPYIE